MHDRAEKHPSAPWRVLALLFLANLLNFFDRTIPAILNEPIRREWGLNDFQLGIIAAAFTVIYAITGLPLGRLADRGSRRKVIGWGVAVWSAFTAANAFAWSFGSFLVARMGVGVGEASYAPAASSLIGDLFPAERRSRALGILDQGRFLGRNRSLAAARGRAGSPARNCRASPGSDEIRYLSYSVLASSPCWSAMRLSPGDDAAAWQSTAGARGRARWPSGGHHRRRRQPPG